MILICVGHMFLNFALEGFNSHTFNTTCKNQISAQCNVRYLPVVTLALSANYHFLNVDPDSTGSFLKVFEFESDHTVKIE